MLTLRPMVRPMETTGPIIDQLAEEVKNVKFVKVDVDQNQELSSQYQVFLIPTFLILVLRLLVNSLALEQRRIFSRN